MSMTAVKEPVQSGQSNRSDYWTAIITGIVVLAHAPLIFAHFQQLWLKPHYQLYPLVLAGGYALVWPFKSFRLDIEGPFKWSIGLMGVGIILVVAGMFGESLAVLPGSPSTWTAIGGLFQFAAIPLAIMSGLGAIPSSYANPSRGMTMVGISWVLLAIAVFFSSATLTLFSALLIIVATTFTLGGWPLFRRCLPALGYLCLLIPPPFGLDNSLVLYLQKIASKLSSRTLDLMGVFHNLTGVTIEVGAKRFEVENACSGISSLLSTLACVLFYVLWYRIHWVRGMLLTVFGVFWVVINNTARIVAITFFDVNMGLNLSTGIQHQILGLLLFTLTLFLIWSTDRLLMFFGRSDLPVRRFEPVNTSTAALTSGFFTALNFRSAWYRSMAFGVLFVLAILAQSAEWYAMSTRIPYSGSALSRLYEDIKLETLPATVGNWHRSKDLELAAREASNPLGQFSRIWRYGNGAANLDCAVSLDYPYPEYHDLRICYENSGWKVGVPRQFQHQTPSGQTLHCVYVPMQRPVEQYAGLWFCNFDQDGVGLVPSLDPTKITTFGEKVTDRFIFAGGRWKRLFFPTQTAATSGLGSIIQVQTLCPSYQPLNDAAKGDLETIFKTAAEKLQSKCVELRNKR